MINGGQNMAKFKRTSLSIPNDLYKKIVSIKEKKYTSFQAVLLECLIEGFNKLYEEDKK
jgi:hypothetical protein